MKEPEIAQGAMARTACFVSHDSPDPVGMGTHLRGKPVVVGAPGDARGAINILFQCLKV